MNSLRFDATERRIVNIKEPDNSVTLDNLECLVLCEFIQKLNVNISKEELIKLWPTYSAEFVPPIENVSRVITSLRKKLSIITGLSTTEVVKNTPRVGFRLGIDVKPYAQKHSFPQKRGMLGMAVIFIAMSYFYFSWIGALQSGNNPARKNGSFVEIYHPGFQKLEPSLSPDGKRIAYIGREEGNEHWSVWIAQANGTNATMLSEPDASYSHPIWLDNNSLAIRKIKGSRCGIFLYIVEKSISNESETPLGGCDSDAVSFGMAKLTPEQLLVTQTALDSEPVKLRVLNISSGLYEPFDGPDSAGLGVYRVFVSQSGSYYATLSSTDWQSSYVNVFQKSEPNRPLYTIDFDHPAFTVGITDSYLAYKSGAGTINIADTATGKLINEIAIPYPHFSPVISDDKLAFLGGDFSATNLLFYKNNMSTPITADEGVLNRLLYSDSDMVIYSSNRTGVTQLWKYEFASNKSFQISRFVKDTLIDDVSISDKLSLIAVSSGNSVKVHPLRGNVLQPYTHIIKGARSGMIVNSKLFFAQNDNDNYQLRYLELNNGTIHNTDNYGVFNLQTDDDLLYFGKYNTPGIWRLIHDNEVELVNADIQHDPLRNWTISKGRLLITREYSEVVEEIDRVTGETIKKLDPICNRVDGVHEQFCVSVSREKQTNRLIIKQL